MAGQALAWDAAPNTLKRFNEPLQPSQAETYGFKGFPEMHMMEPKRPLRHQPSADISTDVNRYFRRDSPTEWMPPPNQQRSPPPAQNPDWLQSKRASPPPAPAPGPIEPTSTLSPRYPEEQQASSRKPPVIRDPLRELTSAEKRKKIEEHYIAEQDRAEARRRREEQAMAKIEEQRKDFEFEENFFPEIDEREQRYGDENRDIDRVRTSMDQARDYPERKEEMLDQQSMHLKKMQEEINKLKAADDLTYRQPPRYETGGRAQSEPQTERNWRRENRDREFWGDSFGNGPDQMNLTPRRRADHNPVGQLYNKESTYKQDFDPPVYRKGRRVLHNPNKDPFEPYAPWGSTGGGAPMADSTGQRRTRIQGSMGVLGRELSDSARARRAHKQELLHTIGEQAAYERARKEAEKAYARQGFVEVADAMRQQKVGYPKYKPSGLIASHHLPHSMSNPYPHPEINKQREYHEYLSTQVEEKNRNTRLGQLEEKRQAREHFRTQDGFFGKRGGGNRKGEDLRKFNLDKAIHNPQSTNNYAGNAPYAESGAF